ncbi:MAG: phage tail protein [Pseudomonadota bacterium]|nr:phage tail protein [Pseudomonadota bacterium]
MASQSYVFGSGVTNIQGVNSFEIGNTYSQYDIVFFSGYTVAGTPPVPTTAESLGVASGHYYYTGTTAATSTAANSPAGASNEWTQKLFCEPSYGAAVSYENQTYDITFGDGYYNLANKSENSLKVNFNLSFNKRSDKETRALVHLLEDSFNKGEKPSGAYTGIYYTPFAPYNEEHEFYIEEINRGYDHPNVNSTSTSLKREDQSILDWQGYYIPFNQTRGFWREGEAYSKHDIVYLSGDYVPRVSGWYYYSGDSETTASDSNGPNGGTTSMWTKNNFYFDINQGVSIGQAPRFIKQPTQSDYYVRTKDGLNKSLLNMELVFNSRTDKEAKAIVHFLESHQGKNQFEFKPPAPYDITGKVFVCPKWQHQLVYKENNDVNVNFIEFPVNILDKSVAFSSLITVDPYFSGGPF